MHKLMPVRVFRRKRQEDGPTVREKVFARAMHDLSSDADRLALPRRILLPNFPIFTPNCRSHDVINRISGFTTTFTASLFIMVLAPGFLFHLPETGVRSLVTHSHHLMMFRFCFLGGKLR